MRELHLEWDDAKNTSNRRKHGVSFEEAATVFYDENALFMADPDHSETEDRFLLLGMSFERKADRSEREQYSRRRRR